MTSISENHYIEVREFEMYDINKDQYVKSGKLVLAHKGEEMGARLGAHHRVPAEKIIDGQFANFQDIVQE